MKKLFTFLLLAAMLPITYAQQNGRWIPQGENLLSNDYTTWDLSAVDENTVWALMCKYSGNGNKYDCTIMRTINGGHNWNLIDLKNLGGTYVVGVFAISETTAWVTIGDEATRKQYIYKTSNAGNSWVEQYSTTVPPNQVWAPAVKFVNEQKGFFIDVYGKKVGRTTNGGNTWTTSTLYNDGSNWFWGQQTQENWWDVKGDTLWWGTSRFISRSLDGGTSWNEINSATPTVNTIHAVKFNNNGLGLAISDANNLTGRAINNTVIQRSENSGTTWNRLGDLPFPLNVISYVPGTEKSFIGVSGSWYAFGQGQTDFVSAYTRDGGESWTVIDRGIARSGVVFVSPTVGWAGRVENFNYGASNPAIFKWEGNLSTNTKDIVKDDFIRVIPNPFTDQTLLEFELKDNTLPVEIVVSDVLGRTIKSWNLEIPNAGMNQLPLTIDAPAGLLLLTLQQGNGVKTIKMIKQ